jgi:hypothetical protein
MRRKILSWLLISSIGLPGIGCGGSKSDGGEANVVSPATLPDIQPLPGLRSGANAKPLPPVEKPPEQ